MEKGILQTIQKGKVYAIIPARSGSKGVKNKNIHCLEGYPMMSYSIAAGLMSNDVDRVIVSTDSEDYAKIARYYGADVPFLRPKEFATDISTDIDFMKHVIQWLYDNEHSVPEFFVHLRPTYPLRKYEHIGNAIAEIKADVRADSLRSAHKAEVCPFKWFQLEDDRYFRPMYEQMSLDDANRPRQSFPSVFIPDGNVDVLKTENIVLRDNMYGNSMIGFITEEGIDVDTIREMNQVEKILVNIDSPILDYLRANYKKLEEAEV